MSPKTTYSACYMCTASCPITVVSEGQRILSIDHPECVRAEAMLEQRESPQRLTTPLLRESAHDAWREVPWDEAMFATAEELQRVRERYGPESIVFAAGYTKEVRPYLKRLARLLGSPHFITESSCCFSSGFVAARVTLGLEYEYFLGPARRRQAQTKCRLVWSNNPAESQMPYDAHHLLVEASQVPTIVVDPRRTSLAEVATIHLQLRPGTDGALALGLAHVIFEQGLQDHEFLAEYGHGVDQYLRYIEQYTPDYTSTVTTIPQDQIVAAAVLYGNSRPAQITISPNATVHHSNGFQAHRAILLLAAICGNLDVEGGNRPWNDRYRESSIELPDWQPPPGTEPLGASRFPLLVSHYDEAQGMVLAEGIESGQVKAVFSIGMNLMMWPNSRRLEQALRSLDLFSTCDFFASPTIDAATVFFPAATHLERQALITAGSGTVQYRPAAVAPPGAARGDTELVFELARHMGIHGHFWNGDIHASYDERLEGSGLRFGDLSQDGRPSSVTPSPVEERSYKKHGFGTPTGKVEFVSTELEQSGYVGLPIYSEPYWSPVATPTVARDYPLVLTSGGRSRCYTNSQGRALETLRKREPEARLQINPADARSRHIREGDRIEVTSPIGGIEMKAWVTDIVPQGVVHAFHGWAGNNINDLIPDEGLDPISGFPPFKSSLCEVRRVIR
ncbi:MAG: molybdopterin-dependent oxidoreductase [Gemmatimonadota bacterium]|nr:MAG: molybdopterin-dependent oxidoreductase [Gemmatimonadota bacterium]